MDSKSLRQRSGDLELGDKKKEVEMNQKTWMHEKRNQNEGRQKKSEMREEGKEVLTLS